MAQERNQRDSKRRKNDEVVVEERWAQWKVPSDDRATLSDEPITGSPPNGLQARWPRRRPACRFDGDTFSDMSGPSEGSRTRCLSSLSPPKAGAVGWRDQQFACGSQRDVRDGRGELFGGLGKSLGAFLFLAFVSRTPSRRSLATVLRVRRLLRWCLASVTRFRCLQRA